MKATTGLLIVLAGMATAGQPARAQEYPTRPIRMVVPYAPGGNTDILARAVAQRMNANWDTPIVVDNRPGGNGFIAANIVAEANPDGYTVLVASSREVSINKVLFRKLPYDPDKDFAPVTLGTVSAMLFAAHPSFTGSALRDIIALAKAQPGKLIHASSATGSASHLTGARLNYITGIKVVNVAFKGGPDATIEILAGRASFHVGTMGVCLPFIKEGKLVALGVTTPQRAPVLPDVPTLGEVLPEFKRPETTHGLVAPAGTPRPIIGELNKQIARILALPDVKERLQNISYVISTSTPEEYDKILRSQIEGLTSLVRDAGLKPK